MLHLIAVITNSEWVILNYDWIIPVKTIKQTKAVKRRKSSRKSDTTPLKVTHHEISKTPLSWGGVGGGGGNRMILNGRTYIESQHDDPGKGMIISAGIWQSP